MNMVKCKLCSKYYKNEERLSVHMTKMHNSNDIIPPQNILKKPQISSISPNEYICNFCSKIFNRIDNYKRHITTCKIKKSVDKTKDDDNLRMQNEIKELKKLVKDLINTNCKMHYKQFNKLQKMLEEKNNQEIINNGTINNGPVNNGPVNNGPVNNGTINNNINNNINIIAFGNEKLEELFTESEKLTVLNNKNNALNFLIEYVHFNEKYPQFHNIIVTNNRADEAYIYDRTTQNFKLVKKNNLIEDLIDYRTCDIEDFYYELKDQLDDNTRDIIEKINKERGDDDITREEVKICGCRN